MTATKTNALHGWNGVFLKNSFNQMQHLRHLSLNVVLFLQQHTVFIYLTDFFSVK